MYGLKDEIFKLVTLNGYDRELFDLGRDLADRRAQLKKDEDRLKLAGEQLAQKKEEQRRRRMEYDRVDVDIKAAEQRFKECNVQLMRIKDIKAYDTMKVQLQTLKDTIANREAAGMVILGEMEELEKTAKLYQEKIDAEAKRLEGVRASFQADEAKLKPELEEKRGRRDAYAKAIDPECLAVYARLLKLPDRRPMAVLDGRTCLGCFSQATPDMVERVKMQDRLILCSSCGRILYFPDLVGKPAEE